MFNVDDELDHLNQEDRKIVMNEILRKSFYIATRHGGNTMEALEAMKTYAMMHDILNHQDDIEYRRETFKKK